jgi:raffinose/stachyose/melibiose transport system substrate-binding protein
MNTRIVAVGLVLLVLLALPLVARGQGESGGEAVAEGDTVELLTLSVGNQANLAGIEAVAVAAEEELGIRLEIELRPSGAEGDNIVKTRLATGDMADLMYYNSGSLFQALNPDRHFVDLRDEPFMERIADSFKETVSVGDGVYGIPADSAFGGGWLYNRRVYDELGLDVPRTWRELMENLETIDEAGIVPVVASFGDTWTAQLIVLGDYYNVHSEVPDFATRYTANEASFAGTPQALRGFEKMQEIHEAGFFNANPVSTSFDDGLRMVATGEAAHYPMLTVVLPSLEDAHGELITDIGFFGQPGDDPDNHGMTLWMADTLAVYADGDNVDAATRFVEFFVSEAGIDAFLSARTVPGPMVIEGVELNDAYPAVQEMMAYVNAGRTAPALEFLSPIKGPNLEQILVQVGMGLTSAQAGAEDYDRDVVRQARQLGLEGW